MDGSDFISQKRRPKLLKILVLIFVVAGIALVASCIWYHSNYPYGYSHCCSAGIGLDLRQYAEDHDGWLPHGKSTPEASLSLLCEDTNTIGWICGKNISRAIAEAALIKDGVLGPKSCGWHYVEGLREGDDPQIAVLWDKVRGLGHNGERRRGMAHEVSLLDGSHQGISESEWPKFIADQKARLAGVIASRQSNSPPIRWSDEESLGPNHPWALN